MSVSSTEHLDKLDAILYGRPASRNIIGFAIDEIGKLRNELAAAEAFYKVAIAERNHERFLRDQSEAFCAVVRGQRDDLVDELANTVASSTVTWIALADRKPEQNQKVLVCAGKMVTAATYEAVPWPNESPWWMACEWFGVEWDFNFMDHEVTHWAPLPEPAITDVA